MAYERRANLGGSNEPVISFLTVKNLGGLITGGLLMWLLTSLFGLGSGTLGLAWGLRLILIVCAALAGLAFTLDFTGISLLDRMLLAFGYWLRKPTGGTIVVPPAAAPVVRNERRSAPLLRDGTVIARPYKPKELADG